MSRTPLLVIHMVDLMNLPLMNFTLVLSLGETGLNFSSIDHKMTAMEHATMALFSQQKKKKKKGTYIKKLIRQFVRGGLSILIKATSGPSPA